MSKKDDPKKPKDGLSMQEALAQGAANRRQQAEGYYDDFDDEVDVNNDNPEQQEENNISNEPTLSSPAPSDIEVEELEEVMARDTVIFASSEQLEAPSINIAEVVDPITQAIRDEIIIKQQLYLQQQMAENIKNEQEKEDFLKKDLKQVRIYLATDEGKDAVKQVMKEPKTQQGMHDIESRGYSAVHKQFDSFKDVDWGKVSASKIRSTEITNDDGQAVCTLKETTINAEPTIVALEDGTTRSIKSFRKIDFPIELETKNGPMHVSMAAKDENGRNVPEKDAVYFTAHYDDNGKLTEVSSPVPVKFMGEGPDAIAYIERNGKAYTLPVTQENYHDMMKEVAKNKGMGVDLSLVVEQGEKSQNVAVDTPAQDKVLQGEMAQKAKVVNSEQVSAKPKQHKVLQGEMAQKAEVVNSEQVSAKPKQDKVLQGEMAQKAKVVKAEQVSAKPKQHKVLQGEMAQKAEVVNAEQPKTVNVEKVTAIKAQEPKLIDSVNPITGKTVDPEIIKLAHAIRVNLGDRSPTLKPTEVGGEIAGPENDLDKIKTAEDAKVAITKALKEGKADSVEDLMKKINNPEDDKSLKIGQVKLKVIYNNGMDAADKLGPQSQNQAAKIKRACGKIAPKAGIDHAQRMGINKGGQAR